MMIAGLNKGEIEEYIRLSCRKKERKNSRDIRGGTLTSPCRLTRNPARVESVNLPRASARSLAIGSRNPASIIAEIDYPIAHTRAGSWHNICCNFIRPASIIPAMSLRSIFDSRRDRAYLRVGSFLNFQGASGRVTGVSTVTYLARARARSSISSRESTPKLAVMVG